MFLGNKSFHWSLFVCLRWVGSTTGIKRGHGDTVESLRANCNRKPNNSQKSLLLTKKKSQGGYVCVCAVVSLSSNVGTKYRIMGYTVNNTSAFFPNGFVLSDYWCEVLFLCDRDAYFEPASTVSRTAFDTFVISSTTQTTEYDCGNPGRRTRWDANLAPPAHRDLGQGSPP